MEIKRDIYDTWDETSRLIPLVARLCGTTMCISSFNFIWDKWAMSCLLYYLEMLSWRIGNLLFRWFETFLSVDKNIDKWTFLYFISF